MKTHYAEILIMHASLEDVLAYVIALEDVRALPRDEPAPDTLPYVPTMPVTTREAA